MTAMLGVEPDNRRIAREGLANRAWQLFHFQWLGEDKSAVLGQQRGRVRAQDVVDVWPENHRGVARGRIEREMVEHTPAVFGITKP